MQIVCPHCETAYGVDPAALGPAGRNVRCARCKETWLAIPEPEMAAAETDESLASTLTGDDAPADTDWAAETPQGANSVEPATDPNAPTPDAPTIDSPSIAADLPPVHGDTAAAAIEGEFSDSPAQPARPAKAPRRRRLRVPAMRLSLFRPGLPGAIAAMAALCIGLVMWRAEIVRLMPQTAPFFSAVGLGVNLRGLEFRDVRLSSETVNGAPVLVIEGDLVNVSRKAIEIPRLRFGLRDASGAEIYAWNTALEQSALNVNEKVLFRSRLATPPPLGREIAIRFFHKRDIAAGG